MIHAGENKAVICKGDYLPAQLYKGETKIAGYTQTAFEGTDSVILENCYNDKIYDAQINGVNDAIVTVRGKNLYNSKPYFFSGTNGTSSKTEKGFKVVCTKAGKSFRLELYFKSESFQKGKTYCVSFDPVNVRAIYVGEAESVEDTSTFDKYGYASKTYYTFTMDTTTKKYINLFFYGKDTAVGDVLTVENIQIENSSEVTSYEPYIEPQTVVFESGILTADIPTFKGTTVIEVEADKTITISGKYKQIE